MRGAWRRSGGYWQPVRLLSSMASTPRTYAAAIDALNSLQSNAATIEAIRKSGKTVNELNEPEMTEYLTRIQHKRDDLNRLNVVHITGTKGKGSTAAFCDALFQAVRPASSKKIGLYTSPHMVAARERIRIDGVPLPEDTFARYFWEVWDSLEQNPDRRLPTTPLRPVYFRFMTLLAFHVFLSERVAVTLLEVGIGGMYDSTNIVQRPVVTGITPLGLDHTAILGHTIEEIALQKAGIFKKDVPALTVEQPPAALAVVESYARQVGASNVEVVPENLALRTQSLGLPGAHQRVNASLALALVRTFTRSATGQRVLPQAQDHFRADLSPAITRALETASWPGRCQVVPAASSAGAVYYLDGAHTVESIQLCVRWYLGEVATSSQPRVLLFNCTNGRSGLLLLQTLMDELEVRMTKDDARVYFTRIIFCTNNTYADGGSASGMCLFLTQTLYLARLMLTIKKVCPYSTNCSVPGAHSVPSHRLPMGHAPYPWAKIPRQKFCPALSMQCSM